MGGDMTRIFSVLAVVLVILAGSSDAQMRHVESGAGFDVGLVIPDGGLHPTFGWGGLMNFGFDLAGKGELHFFPNIEFWISGDEHRGFDETFFEMAVNGDVKYYFPLPKRITVRPFVGTGFGMIYNHQSFDFEDNRDWDDSDSDIGVGVNFMGGIDFPFTPSVKGFAEMKGKIGEGPAVLKFTFGMKFLF